MTGEGSAAADGSGATVAAIVGTGTVSAFSDPQAESRAAVRTSMVTSRDEARFIFIYLLFLLKFGEHQHPIVHFGLNWLSYI
jgi:hypothetical protein